MRDYQLYSLSKDGFQNLVYHVCKFILGDATVNFAEGPDGGRDAKFTGRANSFPSATAPWEGKFIIQAKGGGGADGLCSSKGFEKEIISKEAPKIKILAGKKEVDKYLLFTSRKLGGNTDSKLTGTIKQSTGLTDIWIGGREFLTEEINRHPELISICELPKFVSPLNLHPAELKKVIESFEKCKDMIGEAVAKERDSLAYTDKISKNNLNNLSETYFEYIKESSLSYFKEVDDFLKDPKNSMLKRAYMNSSDEIQSKITIRRCEYDKFEEIFEDIYDIVLAKCPELHDKQRLVNLFLHHMYWNCKIGRSK